MQHSFESVNRTLASLLARPPARIRNDEMCLELRRRIDAEGGGRLRLMPFPAFFDRDEADSVSHAAARLIGIQTTMIRRLLADLGPDAFLERFSIPETMRRFVNWEELCDPQSFVGRVDFLISDSGYRFCEFNVDSSVAGAELFDFGRDYFASLGSRPAEALRAPLADLGDLLARNAERHECTRIVLFDHSADGGSAGKGYFSFDRMRGYIAAATKLPVYIADERSFDPAWLSSEQAPSTLVFRACLISDMVADGGTFLGRMVDAGCKVFSTFESEIRTDKAWFAMFHDEAIRSRLTAQDRELIDSVIPRTVRVHAGNLDALLDDKDRLVFKARGSFGGYGVIIGATLEADEIRRSLLSAGLDTWVAQLMIAGRPAVFPHEPGGPVERHEMVYGLYVYGDRHNGILVRGSTSSKIVNASSGKAGVGWALCIDTPDRRRMEGEIAAQLP